MIRRIIFAALVLGFITTGVQAQTKRALIIAIGNYPDPQKFMWPELNSLHDVPLIQTALEKQQFNPGNIWTLLDSQATKAGIEKALDKLYDSARTGDIIVIHVSSHGEQIEDDNVNEEADGLDECIVPYGAQYSTDKSVFNRISSGYLRDDTFGEKITRLRNKVGSTGDILVTLDACHSGSGTRGGGTAKVRGSNSPMVSANFDMKRMGKKDAAGVFKDNNSTKLNKDAATYVVISGAQAQERNFECLDDEGNAVGSLSYAISKAISTLEGKITYRTLFAQIEDVMREKAPAQKPVLEGDGIDRELFGGKYIRQTPYMTVNAKKSNKDTAILNAGTVSGVTTGSVIGFYPSGTNDPAGKDPMVKGTVVYAGNFTSVVKLEKEVPDFTQKLPWAFLEEMSYGGNTIRISVDSVDAAAGKTIKDALKDYKMAEFSANYDLYFTTSDNGDGYALRYAASGSPFVDNIDIRKPAAIREVMKRFDRYRYLRDLKFSEQDLSAKVELVFLDAKKNIDLNKIKSRTKFGRLELKNEDTVYLRITNTGLKNLFINIVDMQPDGIINGVIPKKGLTNTNGLPAPILPENCALKSKESKLYSDLMIIIGPPYGEEIFKVFLSTQLLDLEDILTSKGDETSRSRGVLNNLAKVFETADNKTGTRGVNPKVSTNQDGTIFSVNFSIVEK